MSMRTTVSSCAIAAVFLLLVSPAMAGDPERGQAMSAVCAACHGTDGRSVAPDFPNIGGQHEQYLYRTLLDYKLGNRQDLIMAGQVAELSRQDMRDLAAFYARQEGGLYLKK